jgi:hypothetical protein
MEATFAAIAGESLVLQLPQKLQQPFGEHSWVITVQFSF